MWRFLFTEHIYKDFAIYVLPGKRRAVVFIHGLGGQALHGAFLQQAFPDHRIFIIELPGHGKAPKIEKSPDVYLIATELQGVFNHFNIDSPILCGHSLGGQIALIYAVIQPTGANSLLLIAPAGLESFNEFQKGLILNTWKFGNLFQNLVPTGVLTDFFPEQVMIPNQQITLDYMQTMMERPVKDLLKQIQIPVHIIFGTLDPLIPNKLYTSDNPVLFAQKATQSMKNCHIYGLPACGHWPMVENPILLIQTIKEIYG